MQNISAFEMPNIQGISQIYGATPNSISTYLDYLFTSLVPEIATFWNKKMYPEKYPYRPHFAQQN